LNKGDSKQINSDQIHLSSSSEIELQKSKKDGVFEQAFQVCVAIGDHQINLYEFKMVQAQDFFKTGY
jgi:hypothetical protein